MATLNTAHNYSPTWLGLATQLGISSSVTAYCILQFEWNRRKKTMQYLYTPRTRLSKNASPPISLGLFSWVRATIFLPEKFYLDNVGLDAVMYIRFLKMALQFLSFNVIVVCSIIMPVNYFGKGNENGVQVFSVNNLDSDNKKYLWAHVVCTYVVSISWMYLLYKNYWDYMNMRRDHFLNKARSGSVSVRTIMVSRVPEELRNEEKLKDYFGQLGLGSVESVKLVRQTGKLDRKIIRRENALLALEKAHIQLAKNVCNATKRSQFFGGGLFERCFRGRKDAKNALELDLEREGAKDYQLLQSLVDWMDRRKKKNKRINGDEQESDTDVPVNKQSGIAATTSTFSLSGSGDFLDQEDGYGHQFLIWKALSQLPKSLLDKYQPTHRTGYFGTGTRVRSIDKSLKKFNYLDRRIAELRSRSNTQHPPTSTAFITFHSYTSAQLAAQSIMCSKPHVFTTKMAPEPRDLLWGNLMIRFREKLVRYTIVNASVWVLTIFWLFPIFAFLTLTSIDSLSQRIRFLGPFLEAAPFVRTLLQNVLPTVLVSFFMSMLPWILMEISKQECFPSYSELEEAVLVRYYHFSFFNVFIVFLLGITFLESIFDVVNQPTSIIETLAKSLPQGATFFINYVTFNICTHNGLELIQVGSQLFLHILLTSRLVATTPRMLQRVTHPWAFQFYYYYPNHILILVITITYSTINPLILAPALVYYAVAYVVFKHQFAYCYVRRYESGGKFFRRVFGHTTDGLIIFQLTVLGLVWLRTAIVTGAFLVPLILATGYFKHYCHKTFYSRTHYLALDTRIEPERTESDVSLQESNSDTSNSDPSGGKSGEKQLSEKQTNVLVSESSTRKEKENENEKASCPVGSAIFNKRSNDKGFQRLESNNGSDGSVPNNVTLKNNGTSNDTDNHIVPETGGDLETEKKSDGLGSGSIEPKKHPTLPLITTPTDENLLITVNSNNSGTSIAPNQDGIEVVPSKANDISINRADDDGTDPTDGKSPASGAGTKFSQAPTTIRFSDGLLNLHPHTPRTPSGFLSRGNLNLTHDPNRKILQDSTSPYQTYIHPNLIKALNRKLWLPRNPLKKITVEDTVELDRALTSSDGGYGIVGYWGGASGFLGEALIDDTTMNPVFPTMHDRAATAIDCNDENTRIMLHRRAVTEGNPPLYLEDNIVNIGARDCGETGEPLTPDQEGIVNVDDFHSGEIESGELTSGETS